MRLKKLSMSSQIYDKKSTIQKYTMKMWKIQRNLLNIYLRI